MMDFPIGNQEKEEFYVEEPQVSTPRHEIDRMNTGDECFKLLFVRGYHVGKSPALFLDHGYSVGTPCSTIDLSPWKNHNDEWPSSELMKRYRIHWKVFICEGASITDFYLLSNVLSKQIVHLSLKNCSLLTDSSVCAIGSTCGGTLKSIDLSGCGQITDIGVEQMTSRCQSLKCVEFDYCASLTDAGVASCIDNCKQLRTASFANNKSVHGSGFLALPCASQSVLLILHKELQHINFSGCSGITDESLRWISESVFNLTKLQLAKCTKLTSTGIGFLTSLQHLRYLDISYCRKLDNQTAESVVQLPDLEWLDISGLSRFTKTALSLIASRCHFLTTLKLKDSKKMVLPPNMQICSFKSIDLSGPESLFSDICMTKLAQQRSCLVDISLSKCPRITESGLLIIVKKFYPTLRCLDISYCQNIQSFGWVHKKARFFSLNLSGLSFVCDSNLSAIVSRKVTRTLRICNNDNLRRLDSCCLGLTTLELSSINLDWEYICKRFPLLVSSQRKNIESFLKTRVDVENSAAHMIQKRYRSFMCSPWFTMRYILIRYRLLTPIAATLLQKLWRGYRVPNHRELGRRFIMAQREAKAHLWRKHIFEHMRHFRHVWASASTIQGAYRAYKWRQRNTSILERLDKLRHIRLFTPIAHDCIIESNSVNVFFRSVVHAHHVDSELSRKDPIFEIGLILEPARLAIVLRKELFQELRIYTKQREVRLERERFEKYLQRERLFSKCAARIQEWIRKLLFRIRMRKKYADERADSWKQAARFPGLCKFQAIVRGWLIRALPAKVVLFNQHQIPILVKQLDNKFDEQHKQLDDYEYFRKVENEFQYKMRRHHGGTCLIEKVKYEHYAVMANATALRITISEQFIFNYEKRVKYHMSSKVYVKKELVRLRAIKREVIKLRKQVRTRLQALRKKKHKYETSTDSKIKVVNLKDNAQEGYKTLMKVETEWLKKDCLEERIEPTLKQVNYILGKIARAEMFRLEREMLTQRDIVEYHRRLSESTKSEWSYRKELFSTKVEQVGSLNDQKRNLRLLSQEARLRSVLENGQTHGRELAHAFLDLCSKPRLPFETSSERVKSQMERRLSRLRKEIQYDAWTILIPLELVKPKEIADREREINERRNRIANIIEAETFVVEQEKREREAEEEKRRKLLEKEENMKNNIVGDDVSDDEEEEDLMEQLVQNAELKKLKIESTIGKEPGFFGKLFSSSRKLEKLRVMRCIMENQRSALGFSAGISQIAITVGEVEDNAMSRAAKRAHKNGEPSFKCVRTNLNAAFEIPEPVYIWYMTTVKIKEHLHTIEIVTDAIPIGEEEGEFVQLVPKNKTVMYVNETNPLKPVVRFRHAELPKFGIVGYTLGKKEDTIVDMKFSLSVKDHETLERKKYSMVDEEILADKFTKHALRDQHHMWLRREKDGTGNKSSSVDSLLKKKAEFEKVLEDNPSNERVKQLIAETEEDIKEAEYNERTEQTGNKTQNSVKLLGLKAKELQTITTHFARMDVDQSGTITVKEFFEYIDIEMDEIRQKLFEFLDNSGDGTMDFHELMYALSTFCMFGPKEILQIVFSLADVSTNGDMTLENFKKLLGMIHEVETQDHPDLDRAIKFTESEIGNRIDFDQMYRIHLKYPRCFKPCFDMQFAMMKKFLGMSFWNRKKSIYEQARAALNEAYETEAKELKKMQLKRLQEEHGVETGLARIQKSFRQTARSTLVKTAPILQNTLSKVGVSVKFLEDGESDDESSEEDDDSDEE